MHKPSCWCRPCWSQSLRHTKWRVVMPSKQIAIGTNPPFLFPSVFLRSPESRVIDWINTMSLSTGCLRANLRKRWRSPWIIWSIELLRNRCVFVLFSITDDTLINIHQRKQAGERQEDNEDLFEAPSSIYRDGTLTNRSLFRTDNMACSHIVLLSLI